MAPNRHEYRLPDVPSLQDLDRIARRVKNRIQDVRGEQKNQNFVEEILHEDEIPVSANEDLERDFGELTDLASSLRYEREERRKELLIEIAENHDNLHQQKTLGRGLGEFVLYSEDDDRIAPPAYLVPRSEGIAAVVFDERTPGNWDAEDAYNAAKLHERTEQVTPELLSYRDGGRVGSVLGAEHSGEMDDYRSALESLEGIHAEPELVSNDADIGEVERLEKTTYRILDRLNAQTTQISGSPEKATSRVEEMIKQEYEQAQPGFPDIDLGYE